MSSNFKVILGINLTILVVYTTWAYLTQDSYGKALGQAFFLTIQVVINLIIAIVNFVMKKKKLGKTYLLSAGLIALIGASACWGVLALS